MDKQKLIEKAANVFASYPTATQLFLTSDGQAFLTENPAKLHASSLKEKQREITPISREEAAGAAKPNADAPPAGKYASLTKKGLQDEIAKRVAEGRTIDASQAKNNAALVALLEADDLAQATPPAE